MFVTRPIDRRDLEALERFSQTTTLGMLSLPRDKALLSKKIELSLASFAKELKRPENELYLFVLEDLETGEVGGVCGIYAVTGIHEPLYFYRVEIEHPKGSRYPLPETIQTLHPVSLARGPSELCSLYLTKEWRKESLGPLLSFSRLLFIGQHQHRFEKQLMARLRGFISKTKKSSPFWEALGRKFLDIGFKEALEHLTYSPNFIAEFLPKYPIYSSFLTKQAQYVIQKTHISTRPALTMLRKKGFEMTNLVDIFDAGPIIQAEVSDITTIQESTIATIEALSDTTVRSKSYLICNRRLDFRASYGTLKSVGPYSVIIPRDIAYALQVKPGDQICYVKNTRN